MDMTFIAPRTAATAVALTALFVAVPVAGAQKPPKGETPEASGPSADASASGCGYTGTTVFSAWNDKRGYTLTPDGGFEGGAAGWTLAGGAAVAEGNETFQAGGPADHQSLGLPAGSSATSPAICVAKHEGIVRLFARTDGGHKSRLKVEVLYANGRRGKTTKLRAGDAWAPTRKLGVALGRGKGKGKLTTASITLRFTPIGAPAAWQIDDVYIDPRLRH